MKVSFNRSQFASAFHTVAQVCPARTPKPELMNVRMIVSGSLARLYATDIDISVEMPVVPTECTSGGDVLLNANRLNAILRECQNETISLELDTKTNVIFVQCGFADYELPTEDAAKYPMRSIEEGQKTSTVKARALHEAIRKTVYAVDPASTRYALVGIKIEPGKGVDVIGTDGRRLSHVRIVGNPDGLNSNVIVPQRMCKVLMDVLDVDGDALIQADTNYFTCTIGGSIVSGRMVEGRYPNWQQVLPKERGSHEIVMMAGPFLAAIRQAAIVAESESRQINLEFTPGKLSLWCKTADVGSSKVELPIAYDGPKLVIAVDHRFVSDFLKCLPQESSFNLFVTSATEAVLFTTDDSEYVVMPMSRS